MIKIITSTDYEAFKLVTGNRVIDMAKVKKISDDINNGLNLMPYVPIIVNEHMLIIDGQHRYTVCRNLNIPVHYVVASNITLGQIAQINSRSTSWKNEDFLNCYVNCGNEHYITFKNFLEKYDGIKYTDLAGLLYTGNIGNGKILEKFKQGLFEAKFKEEATELLDFLYLFSHSKNWSKRNFMKAMIMVKAKGNYDHDRMIDRMEQELDYFQTGSWKEYITQIERSYNFRLRERVILV